MVICECFFEVGRLEPKKCFLQFKALASVLYLNIAAGIFGEKGLQFLSGVGQFDLDPVLVQHLCSMFRM